jgi:hypothetical protein
MTTSSSRSLQLNSISTSSDGFSGYVESSGSLAVGGTTSQRVCGFAGFAGDNLARLAQSPLPQRRSFFARGAGWQPGNPATPLDTRQRIESHPDYFTSSCEALMTDWRPLSRSFLWRRSVGLVSPRQPRRRVGKDCSTVLLQRHEIIQDIDAGGQTSGNQAGGHTDDIGAVFGGVEWRVLALLHKTASRPAPLDCCRGSADRRYKSRQRPPMARI